MKVVNKNDLLGSFFVQLIDNANSAREGIKNKYGRNIGIRFLTEYCVKKYNSGWIEAYEWAIGMDKGFTEDVMNMFYNMSLDEACLDISINKE